MTDAIAPIQEPTTAWYYIDDGSDKNTTENADVGDGPGRVDGTGRDETHETNSLGNINRDIATKSKVVLLIPRKVEWRSKKRAERVEPLGLFPRTEDDTSTPAGSTLGLGELQAMYILTLARSHYRLLRHANCNV